MYEALYRFLIRYRKVDLPGIGAIALQMQSSRSEFVNHSFLPPSYFFSLEKGKETPSRKIFSWLAANFSVTEREAVVKFNDFVFDLRNKLDAGKEIAWDGVGVLRKEPAGDIKFTSFNNNLSFLEEVVAEKVIRENAQHTMLVGEYEKTSTQMTEILSGEIIAKDKSSHWWIWPLAAMIVILLFLGWYFSEHGISSSSTGNNHKISVQAR
jgi:hypothetical protein